MLTIRLVFSWMRTVNFTRRADKEDAKSLVPHRNWR